MILRAEFMPVIRARSATHGIQFGCLQRPTHENTSWEQAAFEVPGHLWMDIAQPGRGLAILDDGSRLGRSCRGNRMGLSLVRATGFPDPRADRGVHCFTYGIMPHRGDWRQEGVADHAERMLRRPRTMTANAGKAGGRPDHSSCLPGLDSLEGVELSACKRAEDGRGWIIRLVENRGGCTTARFSIPDSARTIHEVDLLEEPRTDTGLEINDGRCSITLNPFQIRTLRIC